MKQIKYHFKLCDEISKKYNGFIVKTIGDAFMIYFKPDKNSLLNAIQAAEEIIKQEKVFKLRVGICKGAMEQDSYVIQNVRLRDYYGNAVNLASRMESRISSTSEISFSILDESINNISSDIKEIKNKYKNIKKINISNVDLRGAKTNNCYKILIK